MSGADVSSGYGLFVPAVLKELWCDQERACAGNEDGYMEGGHDWRGRLQACCESDISVGAGAPMRISEVPFGRGD